MIKWLITPATIKNLHTMSNDIGKDRPSQQSKTPSCVLMNKCTFQLQAST